MLTFNDAYDNDYMKYWTISLCWLFYLLSYFARVEPSALLNELTHDFSFTTSKLGTIISMAYIPYVIMQIPCGILVDRYSTRFVVSISCILCALGTLIFGIGQSDLHLMIGRFLIGLSTASAFLCCGKLSSELFPKEKYALLVGIAMFIGCLGGVFGINITSCLVNLFNWRNLTCSIAFFGIVIGILCYLYIPTGNIKHQTQDRNTFTGIKLLVKNKIFWIIGIYGCMSYLPLSAFAELWGLPFMQTRFQISASQASICPALMFISFGIGSMLSADVVKKINSYKKTLLLFTIGLITTFVIAIYNNNINFITCVILFSLGSFFAGANTLTFAMSYALVPPEYAGTSSGIANMCIMSSGIIFQPLLGKLLDFFRNNRVDGSGTPLYEINDYRSALIFVMLGIIIAFIAILFIKDPQKIKSNLETNV